MKKKDVLITALIFGVILLGLIFLPSIFIKSSLQGRLKPASQISHQEMQKIQIGKPRHLVFLIHGIAGTKEHFGAMRLALNAVLNKKDSTFAYIVKSLEYETGNDEKTTYDFAQDINKQILKVIGPSGLKPEEKISLVMHSQGGLVGSIWMLQSLLGTEGFGRPALMDHLDAFITIGTPFWGAKSAEFGRDIDGFFSHLGIDLKVPFGSKELQEMSIGSDTVYDFRRALVDPRYHAYIKKLKEHVRLLNIAGTAKVLKPIGIFASGGENYEDEGAVPLPSARFNFLFSQSILENYEEGDTVSWENTREVNFAPCIIVEGLHRAPLPEITKLADIVYVPEACVLDENCSHPTFGYVWKYLLGENVVAQNKEVLDQYKSFLIDVNVRLPEDSGEECRDIQIQFTQPDGSSLDKKMVEISNFFELFSEGKNVSVKYPNQCRYYFTGNLYQFKKDVPSVVLMKLSGEGLKARAIEVQLKPSYSSFVDINLIER